MKFEVGKFYRTRDGRKVGPMNRDKYGNWLFAEVDGGGPSSERCFREDGKHEFGEANLDIVAEWTDAPESLDTARRQAAEEDFCACSETREPETELERLVRVANVGLDAMRTLYQTTLGNQVRLGASEWMSDFIKRRPAFEPFYVGPDVKPAPAGDAPPRAWRVSLSDDGKTLSVGCQTFDARQLYNALDDILRKRGYWNAALKIHSTRDGLRYGDYVLSWSDADKILAALEAYFGKEKL
jgi:hypothetical protein